MNRRFVDFSRSAGDRSREVENESGTLPAEILYLAELLMEAHNI